MYCVILDFLGYFKFEKRAELSKDERPPCGRNLGVATGRQRAGNTTSQERYDGSARV